MKKAFCVIICILLALFTCSCKSESTVSSKIENQSTFIDASESSSQESSKNTETESVNESETSQTTQAQPETESKTNSQVAVETSSTVNSELNYTINDPNNLRGLSTTRIGFSYGIAKNGVAHGQSLSNQQIFDSFENVEALAVDTKTQEKVMYLTFDNGYEYKNLTANILDTLKGKKVKAAFFVTLSYVKQNPELVRRMINEGHIVGNHSTTHPVFPGLTRTQMAQEVLILDNYLKENFSYKSQYFRFPTGAYSECALELVTSVGFRSIFWSVAYADWDKSTQKGADYAFSTVTSRFHPGAVILLHAVSQDNADALGRIIDQAHNEGYKFNTLDQYSY